MSNVNVMSMSKCQKSGHVNDKEIGNNVCVNQMIGINNVQKAECIK